MRASGIEQNREGWCIIMSFCESNTTFFRYNYISAMKLPVKSLPAAYYNPCVLHIHTVEPITATYELNTFSCYMEVVQMCQRTSHGT